MPNDLCRFHDAFVSQEGDTTWTIGNSGIRLTVGFDLQHGFGLRELVDGASGHTWRGSDSAEQFRVEWNGATLTGRDARTAEAHAFVEDGAVRLVVALELGNELRATVHYRLMPGTAAIQQWLEIEAHAAGTLYQATPLALGIDHHGSALLRWVRGVQQQGGWRPDAGPYNSFRIAQVVLGQHPLQSGMRSTWDEIPWLVVSRDDHGSGIFAGLQYSGRWQAATSADGATLQIRLGPSGIAPELAAGAHWTSSRAFVGVYTGD